MNVDDIPKEFALKDMLFRKIQKSELMKLDLSLFDNMAYDDPERNYKKLLAIMDKHIQKVREEKNFEARTRGLKELLRNAAPAPKVPPKVPPTPPKHAADPKITAPVLPQPHPKNHNGKDDPKGKGKGRGKRRKGSRSPSTDTSRVPCAFHFGKGKEC